MTTAGQRMLMGSVAFIVASFVTLSYFQDRQFSLFKRDPDLTRPIIGSKPFGINLQEWSQLFNRELVPLPDSDRKDKHLTTNMEPPIDTKKPMTSVQAERNSETVRQDNSNPHLGKSVNVSDRFTGNSNPHLGKSVNVSDRFTGNSNPHLGKLENVSDRFTGNSNPHLGKSVNVSDRFTGNSNPHLGKSVNVSERFTARRKQLREVCQKLSPIPWKKIMESNYDEFAYKRLAYCRIPKVGTTFMSYFENKVLKQKLKFHSVLLLSAIPTRKNFFIVREPYARLVAGYICKIVLTGQWWQMYGKYIVEHFRPDHHSGNTTTCGNDVTFPEFVRYFIHSQETGKKKNHHWAPMHEQCEMCQANYDYILHLETFTDDFDFLLKSVNVSTDAILDYKERELKGKSKGVFKFRAKVEHCEPVCATLRKAWWSFKVRGFISKDLDFPLDEKNCSAITPEVFASVSWDAHLRSVKLMNTSKQKRDAVVELYLQIPLENRLKLKDIFQTDFDMFGYDPLPADLFPELKK